MRQCTTCNCKLQVDYRLSEFQSLTGSALLNMITIKYRVHLQGSLWTAAMQTRPST